MNQREYRDVFWISLVLSLVIHALILLLTRIPPTWVREEPERKELYIPILIPEVTGLQPPVRREAIEIIDVKQTFEELKPLALREARPIPLPGSLIPELFPLEPYLTWDMIMDLSHIKLLPPYYFSRFAWQFPDTTKRVYTVNDYIHLALLDALRAREEKEKMLVDTPLGEFGVTPGVIHLGPLKLPIPFGAYSSRESRIAQQEYGEIQSHENVVEIDDEELARQRERILEWKKRHGKDD
ncbi:MAG: hypothetical protein ACE5OP_02400 [Candidatus Glassbacteria bacterium]